MSPEAQRIAIAEACGWTEIYDNPGMGVCGRGPNFPQKGNICVPDYLDDLNAIREAEGTLTDDKRMEFVWLLSQVVAGNADQDED